MISHDDIKTNPKTLAKAGVVWSQIEILRCEYEHILDEAFSTLGDSDALNEALAGDEKQWEWLTKIEKKLEELIDFTATTTV